CWASWGRSASSDVSGEAPETAREAHALPGTAASLQEYSFLPPSDDTSPLDSPESAHSRSGWVSSLGSVRASRAVFGAPAEDLSLAHESTSDVGIFRGGRSRACFANAAMCAGVVPQQPPTMFNQPLRAHCNTFGAKVSGVSGNPVSESGSGSPAFG